MRRKLSFLGCIVLLVALTPDIAAACAALFSAEAQVRQSAQRIIFAVDKAQGKVEAYVSVNYVGAAEEFAWVVPLPNNPQVDVIEAASFNTLELATNPRFLFPQRTCQTFDEISRSLDGRTGSAPPGSGVDVLQQGQVGPYDFSVVGGTNGGDITDWLRQNGYRVTQPMEPLITSYTDMGMVFLAMKLQGGKEAGDIQPVKMTFDAQQAMIPLRLAAVGAQPDTELLVWVFADRQVAPENMQRLTIPDEQIGVASFRGENNYAERVTAALQQANGQGLVTEVAQPVTALNNVQDPLISQLRQRFPYVTRMYGRFDPEQMTIDPMFALQDGLNDIAITRDFRNRVEPYECGDRSVIPIAEQSVLADSPQGMWIEWRSTLLFIGGAMLVIVLIVVGVRSLRRRAR
jgi:hypothetical protein